MTIQPDRKLITKYYLTSLLTAFFAILVSGGIGALIASDEGGRTIVGFLIGGGINLVWLLPVLLWVVPYYNSITYTLEGDEVIARQGFITTSVKHVPYRTMTNIEIKRDPFDRLLGIGRVHIQTAGMSGEGGAEENLVGLVDYDGVYERVATTLRRYRGGMLPDQAGSEPVGTEAELLSAILDELRDMRQARSS